MNVKFKILVLTACKIVLEIMEPRGVDINASNKNGIKKEIKETYLHHHAAKCRSLMYSLGPRPYWYDKCAI